MLIKMCHAAQKQRRLSLDSGEKQSINNQLKQSKQRHMPINSEWFEARRLTSKLYTTTFFRRILSTIATKVKLTQLLVSIALTNNKLTIDTHVKWWKQLLFIFDVQNGITTKDDVERFRRKFTFGHISNFKLNLLYRTHPWICYTYRPCRFPNKRVGFFYRRCIC